MLRIIRELKHVSSGNATTNFVVENVIMDSDPEAEISKELGCRPVLIDAKPVCASARERLWWLNFNLHAQQGEVLQKGSTRNELKLVEDPDKVNIWDVGWKPISSFKDSLPTVQGWRTWAAMPGDPRGIKMHLWPSKEGHPRSADAIARWENDHWSSAITFYEEYSMAQKGKALRCVCPTETERLLGSQPIGRIQRFVTPTKTTG